MSELFEMIYKTLIRSIKRKYVILTELNTNANKDMFSSIFFFCFTLSTPRRDQKIHNISLFW